MRYFILILGVLSLVISSCSREPAVINGSVGGDNTINVQIAETKAIFGVTNYQVTNAAISLVQPNGSTNTSLWTSASPVSSFIFSASSPGSYTLQVLETDTFPHVFSASASFTVSPGFDYVITVTLGGNITVNTQP
jgi:hypothetical protein